MSPSNELPLPQFMFLLLVRRGGLGSLWRRGPLTRKPRSPADDRRHGADEDCGLRRKEGATFRNESSPPLRTAGVRAPHQDEDPEFPVPPRRSVQSSRREASKDSGSAACGGNSAVAPAASEVVLPLRPSEDEHTADASGCARAASQAPSDKNSSRSCRCNVRSGDGVRGTRSLRSRCWISTNCPFKELTVLAVVDRLQAAAPSAEAARGAGAIHDTSGTGPRTPTRS
mmetsp:Transcript_111194/g.313802  ORF Transcript_111194/g.313802 Transcript_111194/m.313802 type:complete len:228 (-) Transcript_111194:3-686(-)